MENKCFIMLPNQEPSGYAKGHFNRVYDYIVVPACRVAGFWPERADNPNVTTSGEIIKNLIESEIVVCDLSTSDSTVLYAVAIRQALNLPVTLIKDGKTQLSFFNKDLQVLEYDDSLRIDTVQKITEELGAGIKASFDSKGEPNTIFNRLGITFVKPQPQPVAPVIEETYVHEAAPAKEVLPVISPLPDYVGAPLSDFDVETLKPGDFLFHINHGKGEIKTVRKLGKDKMAEVVFESGQKILVLNTSGSLLKVIG